MLLQNKIKQAMGSWFAIEEKRGRYMAGLGIAQYFCFIIRRVDVGSIKSTSAVDWPRGTWFCAGTGVSSIAWLGWAEFTYP